MATMIEARTIADPASDVLDRWLSRFDDSLGAGDTDAAASLFVADCHWRDILAFTWNIRTIAGRVEIKTVLDAVLAEIAPANWRRTGEATEQDGIVSGFFSFETALGRGDGFVRLRNGECWTLLTTLKELKGFEEKSGRHRPLASMGEGSHHSWRERREAERAALGDTVDPFVVVIGGGQGGLALGARLKMLGVPALVVDKFAKSGDQWRSRYRSLRLHDPVWYDHLPYLPFPEHWPVYMTKDQIGDWLESYEKIMDLDVWHSTTCLGARYDERTESWTVDLDRDGEKTTIGCKHLVFATGMFGLPAVPTIKGADTFEGVQHHSSQYRGGTGWEDRKVVVIGANTSAHDICADLVEHGADVTMIQRSSTLVVSLKAMRDLLLEATYSHAAVEAGMTTEKADLLFASMPYSLLMEFNKPIWEQIRAHDSELHRRLEAVGFQLDFGEDESGLWAKYIRRGGGYYIDVGASELIASGRIKLKSGKGVAEIRPHSVVLDDGEELPADLIVYATGFGPMNDWVSELISPEVARRVGKCWGIGSGTARDPGPWEGELRNMWKPTAQPGLWFHGGNLHQSRDFSRYLALQLKARMEELPLSVYGEQTVHHER